ncbi:acyl carrier protein [Streptomyces sp. NPDC058622]|uniref:acyl carrier protein n=1 Tax=Streptomyces sp. NPDC058622 TaxID=3346562 RepID=UPI0036565095
MAADILAEITGMLVEIVGDEYLLADEVTMKTTFNEDLALESIEFVALAELLHQRYGSRVDLMGFLAEKDMDAILAMSVGELVTHIGRITHASLARNPAAPGSPTRTAPGAGSPTPTAPGPGSPTPTPTPAGPDSLARTAAGASGAPATDG